MQAPVSGNRFSRLDGRPEVSPELLDLERGLHTWRQSIAGKLAEAYPAGSVDIDALASDVAGGGVLAGRFDPVPAPTLLGPTATAFLAAIEQLPIAPDLRAWLERDTRDRLTAWFSTAWQRDRKRAAELAGEAGVEADVLLWSGRQLARPFFHRLGALLGGHAALASHGAKAAGCPCCGGPPRMARLEREEGRRQLWCDLCDLEWTFPRVTCPFCLNTNHEQLGYLAIEGQSKYRIDVCEACHGYLRTLDERETPEGSRVDFLIEDIGTHHLCIVAEKHEYREGGALGDPGVDPNRDG